MPASPCLARRFGATDTRAPGPRRRARQTLVALGLALWLAPAPGEALSLAVGLDFTGASFGTQSSSFPPDTMGSVGPGHVVELVNGRYNVYRKSDGAKLQTSTLNQFWTAAGTAFTGSSFDPRVIYDATSNRWLAAAVDNARGPNGFLVAVSNGSDPTAGWKAFRFDSDATDTNWADYPTLGYDADTVTVAATMFPIGSSTLPAATSVVILPKSDLLAPVPTAANATTFQNVSVGFQAQPVVDLDGGGMPGVLLSGTIAPLGLVLANHVTGTPAAPVLSPLQNVLVPGAPAPPTANQPGPKANLDAGDSRFGANVIEQLGRIWAVHTVDVAGRAAIRWLSFDAGTLALQESGFITDPSLDLYYPSIAINEFGEIVIGMSGSSEAQYASSYAVLGQHAGGVTGFGSPLLLEAGLADYQRLGGDGRNRFGDYSATVVDPTSPHAFWTFQEYVPSANVWGVRITQLFVVPEPASATLLVAGTLVLVLSRRGSRAVRS